ncbi:MAG TPA: hypothetical protein VFQ91_21625 [Bryobacteraceae bacterium]|nr:hypothetical protein [Bryobacteraceae bacterium]
MPIARPALLVQLQPITPWRCGVGRPEEPASLVPSDSLFGAVCDAMRLLGWLPEWLQTGAPATRFTSLLPVQNDIYYAPLPEKVRTYAGLRRVRLEAVRFATLAAIADLAAKKFDENRWVLDMGSGCLQPTDRTASGSPFRSIERHRSAVDRLSGVATTAAAGEGVEFAPHAGAWGLFVFDGAESAALWAPRLKAVFRLLSDAGIGGWRNAGWGRSRRPRFREGEAGRLLAQAGWKPAADETATTQWWTLGLFAPHTEDAVAWDQGAYRTMGRAGWVEGAGSKPALRFVREGAVLVSETEPMGRISESTVEGAAYPVTRYGAGLALPWPWEAQG